MDHVPTNVDKSRSPWIVPFAILGVMSMLAGLAVVFALLHAGKTGAGNSGDNVPTVSALGPTSFVNRGPFGVGQTTLKLASGASVEVWYPASPDGYHGAVVKENVLDLVPTSILKLFPALHDLYYPTGGIRNVTVGDGKFPLVLFSHGFAGWNMQSSFLTAHLASWGFVVAAPEHPDRDLTSILTALLKPAATGSMQSKDVTDLRQTIDLMTAQDESQGSRFYQHLDLDRIGAVGHSAGGSAVEKLAVVDSRVKDFIGLAGASYGALVTGRDAKGSAVPTIPGMLEFGSADGIVMPSGMVNAYNAMRQPKRLVTFTGAGHLVFADICQLNPGGGGLVGEALKANLPVPERLQALGTDGCSAPSPQVTLAWPAIRQSVTAQLRWALGFDSTQAGLDGLSSAFSGVIGLNTTANSTTLVQVPTANGN
ncbi:MAG: hypothetical protein WCI12_09145 [Actinomycetes bacterium]